MSTKCTLPKVPIIQDNILQLRSKSISQGPAPVLRSRKQVRLLQHGKHAVYACDQLAALLHSEMKIDYDHHTASCAHSSPTDVEKSANPREVMGLLAHPPGASITPSPLKLDLVGILAMNPYPAGTRVFFWANNAQIVYGTVESTSRMPDGTQVLVIKKDGGGTVCLPAAGITKVT
ncbi:hypothetical protein LshimejAT787_0206520 [Lyophyllum shimeji]|uniref:Uncharacterized protein n=1 Tax=Lyophyllum shimeji TaxID=47721 RepID=A0A9P3PGR2_LYOSH|nr:hypothetical protein LshimejAT787_0206520 [Lyophyllum shimeji]